MFVAIASPVRRAVLDMLRERPRPVREIASAFAISRPAISQHLAVLRDASLVVEKRAGREHFYELDASRLADVDRWLAEYETFWKAKLRNLRDLLDEPAPPGEDRD